MKKLQFGVHTIYKTNCTCRLCNHVLNIHSVCILFIILKECSDQWLFCSSLYHFPHRTHRTPNKFKSLSLSVSLSPPNQKFSSKVEAPPIPGKTAPPATGTPALTGGMGCCVSKKKGLSESDAKEETVKQVLSQTAKLPFVPPHEKRVKRASSGLMSDDALEICSLSEGVSTAATATATATEDLDRVRDWKAQRKRSLSGTKETLENPMVSLECFIFL
ncbi:hypothetical protein QJS10_CPB21g00705 [Acorus calamus]|uniref:Uncharacterized protein n=1 Tax=Acorus calamus TaxID=4465 RepID=A0AAV9C4P2_ACOCL|nr:hypothetical protein QJS10_CPB21g00705 [Acorus calamus]